MTNETCEACNGTGVRDAIITPERKPWTYEGGPMSLWGLWKYWSIHEGYWFAIRRVWITGWQRHAPFKTWRTRRYISRVLAQAPEADDG